MRGTRPTTPASVPRRDPANISAPSTDVSAGSPSNVRSLDPVGRLVERAKDGDKDAYGQVFRLHHDAIRRFARVHLGPDVDDAVAEVFTRAWICLPRYQPTGAPFVAWLYGIARHVVADELSRRTRTEPRAQIPETLAEWAEDDRLALTEAIAKLPEEQRQVIEMKFFMGMRNPEVAEAMDSTANAVNAKQWRALGTLRDELEKDA
jgi:RNA polymerase sigma-70 factor, ECF subfamily